MNQSTYNALKSFIWGIANDCLVDVYDVGDYRKGHSSDAGHPPF